ncbi:MAG TPA: hypothetical protein EYQ60_19130 [Myxococcales bacterium]|nr:hypothetical protein [Myxococcales bacterium]HIK86671.1 hypothetical protein [Myxococcales bacterium]
MNIIRLFKKLSPILLCALLLACPSEQREVVSESTVIWPPNDLVAIEMISDARAIALSTTGEIHWTSDLGETWSRSHLPAVNTLRGISMVDEEVGWAVGEGIILRTDDGGVHWRRQRLPGQSASMPLVGVHAIRNDRAIAVAANGLVLGWKEGGTGWVVFRRRDDLDIPRPIERLDIACAPDSGRCWSMGRLLERSDNAGESWRVQVPEDFARFEEIEFSVGQVDLVDRDRERLREFVAANRHRKNLEWVLEPIIGSLELERMGRPRDATKLFELIAARLEDARAQLEDSSISATRIIVLGDPPWNFDDYLDDEPNFLESYFRERSGEESELRLHLREQRILTSLWMGEAGLGLAVGRAGVVLRSVDGGDRWQAIVSPTTHDLNAVAIGGQRAVVVGAQGGLWTSADAGERWRPWRGAGEAVHFDSLLAISFSPSGKTGMAVGDRQRILRSVDGGESWTELQPRAPSQAERAR